MLALKVQFLLPIVIVLVAFITIDLVVDSGAVLVEETLIVAVEDVLVGMTNEEVTVLSGKERIRSKEWGNHITVHSYVVYIHSIAY